MEQERFEAWGIVDLFGHTRLAGRITEQTIGGETFIRVDVPNGDGFHTRLFGKGAIYGMALTDEAIARAASKAHTPRPVSAYDVPALLADQRAAARTLDPIPDDEDVLGVASEFPEPPEPAPEHERAGRG